MTSVCNKLIVRKKNRFLSRFTPSKWQSSWLSSRKRESGRGAPAFPFPQSNKLQLCHFDRPASQSEAAGKEGEIWFIQQ